MKKGNCTECDKPLFDQNPDETRQLCDECVSDLCPDCHGTGEVPEQVWDNDSHNYLDVGNQKCLCQIKNDDE